jgi:hypothetical protein
VIRTYEVDLQTKAGRKLVTLKSTLGPDAAARRAFFTLVASGGYGDLEDVHVLGVKEIEDEDRKGTEPVTDQPDA